MIWYYAKEGKPAGPLEDPEFQKLVTDGVIRPETQVWNETMTRWERWEVVAPTISTSSTPPPPLPSGTENSIPCDLCGKTASAGEWILLNGIRVCIACKPQYVQALKEGTTQSRHGGDTQNMEAVTLLRYSNTHALPPRIGDTLRAALRLLQQEWGTMAGATFLTMLLAISLGIGLESATQFLPKGNGITILRDITSSCITGALTGPLTAGLLWMFLKVRRNEDHSISLLLSGFQNSNCRDLIVVGMMEAVVSGLGFLPMNLLMPENWGADGISEDSAKDLTIFACMFFGMAIYILNMAVWSLAPLLVMDRGYHWKDALITSFSIVWRHRLTIPITLFLATLASLLGFAALCVGVIFTLPFGIAPIIIFYEQLCGREIGREEPS